MDEKLYKKYRRRVAKEGFFKSLFCGVIAASAVTVVIAFVLWFFDVKWGIFISLGAFIVVAAAVTSLFYSLKYRPTVKQIAARVDELGLEERVLTMTELKDDDSEIAAIQRADTMSALASVDHMRIKIMLSAALWIPFAIFCALFAGAICLSALHFAGVIPSGLVTLTPEYIPGVFNVLYSVEEGGEGSVIYWTGDWSEEVPVSETGDMVEEGKTARAVYAVPAENWAFVSWSDGKRDPYRQDTVANGDIFVQAIFEAVEPDPSGLEAEINADEENRNGEGQEGQEGSGGQQTDGGQQSQEGEPQPGDADEGEDGDSDVDGDNGGPQGNPGDKPGASGARDLSSQQIVDGKTYYGDQFDDAYDQAKDRLDSDTNIPDDLKDYIEDYYHSIETGGSEDGNG